MPVPASPLRRSPAVSPRTSSSRLQRLVRARLTPATSSRMLASAASPSSRIRARSARADGAASRRKRGASSASSFARSTPPATFAASSANTHSASWRSAASPRSPDASAAWSWSTARAFAWLPAWSASTTVTPMRDTTFQASSRSAPPTSCSITHSTAVVNSRSEALETPGAFHRVEKSAASLDSRAASRALSTSRGLIALSDATILKRVSSWSPALISRAASATGRRNASSLRAPVSVRLICR